MSLGNLCGSAIRENDNASCDASRRLSQPTVPEGCTGPGQLTPLDIPGATIEGDFKGVCPSVCIPSEASLDSNLCPRLMWTAGYE